MCWRQRASHARAPQRLSQFREQQSSVPHSTAQDTCQATGLAVCPWCETACVLLIGFHLLMLTHVLLWYLGSRCGKTMCIPYIGVILSDITFTEDGNKSTVPNPVKATNPNHINFLKYRRYAVPACMPVSSCPPLIARSQIGSRPGPASHTAVWSLP